jgi:hypothetical protein
VLGVYGDADKRGNFLLAVWHARILQPQWGV